MNEDLEKTQEIPIIDEENPTEVAYTSIDYFDENWLPTPKDKGSRFRITEYSKNGKVINEAWGEYNPHAELTNTTSGR